MEEGEDIAWLNALPAGASWMGVWRGLGHCDACGALMGGTCPQCGFSPSDEWATVVEEGGRTFRVPPARQGTIPYATHLLLGMMQREWERPLHDDHWLGERGPLQRASIVLLFWTQFEILAERLLEAGMADYPERVRDDLLRRYGGVGARLEQLYRIVFGGTFWQDLKDQGDSAIATHLQSLQRKRNEFAHGRVESIKEIDILRTVQLLQDSQAAWIRVYNRRCSAGARKVPVWDVRAARHPADP